MSWTSIKSVLPKKGIFVQTKVSDHHGERNFQELKLENNLWFSKDGMYVYYTPTHWKYN